MPDGLYERDALAWSDQQADLLRRIAAGERLNADVDWANVIEEVQDVGLSGLRAVRSLLRQAMMHLLKLHAWPNSSSAAHWRIEVGAFLVDAEDAFAPSMRQRVSLDETYTRALYLIRPMSDDSGPPRAFPAVCPYTLDDLVTACPDIALLLAKLEV